MEINDSVEIEVVTPKQEEEKLILKGKIVKVTLVLKLTMRQSRRIRLKNTNGWEYKRINKHKKQKQKHRDSCAQCSHTAEAGEPGGNFQKA